MDKMKKVGLLGATALIGAGLAALSEEKIRDLVKDKIEEGSMTKEEGKRFVEDLVSDVKKQRLDLEKNIVEKLQCTIQMADQGLENLSDKINEMKIRELEDELEKMKGMRKAK